MKKVIVKIENENVLKEADYVEIETIHNDNIQIGYVRYYQKGKRFHLIPTTAGVFELHIDSLKKKHKVIHGNSTLIKESSRIKQINKLHKVIPLPMPSKKKKNKRQFKDEYAPNLIELQKSYPLHP